jgi:deaminated glutathione amidase
MKIAAVQMVSTPDVDRNLDAARLLIAQAAAAGARLVALPEYFCLLGRSDRDKLAVAEQPGDGPIQQMLSAAAREHALWLVGGTLPLRISGDSGHVRNACCVYSPQGTLAARYDKMHLFGFDDGNERHDESRVLEAGSEVVALDLEPDRFRLGLSICYDLRFPELYRKLSDGPQAGDSAASPCDVFAVPSAFTHTTGQAHWELLLRARAVENQAYVIAPAQGGLHENGRRTWGHSLIVDPWGVVLACLPTGEGFVTAKLDASRIAEVRRQLPALAHRRLRVAAGDSSQFTAKQ